MSVDPAAEEQFGPYRVYERLGVGGMATVHRALEHGTGGVERTVALKRLLPHLAEDASFIKSFVREAKLASLLDHVNIVQIYELGRVGTEYFISMEYIDGRDVRRLLRHARKVTGPPPIYVTVGLMIQLCDALDYAHNRVDEDGQPLGLVHRDISPSNLIVTSGGHLKIIDFGIAKAQSSQLRTQTGRVKGKLAYMSPEAISGSRDLDARSDIWAAGVILHELCTARPLFASKNEYQTLLKVQRGDIIPPSTFNQSCPAELDAIVFRALARDANERFSSAAELRQGLVAVKRQYNLQTGFRDVAGWIEWAFGIDSPGSFSGDTSGVVSIPSQLHNKTPRPPTDQDEDEAVEVVWGSGNVESEDGPVVLDEVPDVSRKHRARRDTEDEAHLVDDIPTPLPSHGTLPSIYGAHDPEIVVVPQPSPRSLEAERARGTDQPKAAALPRTVTGPQPLAPKPGTGAHPVVPRTATGAQPVVRPGQTLQAPQRRSDRQSVPPAPASDRPSDRQRVQRPTSPGIAPEPRGSDRMATSAPVHVDTPQIGDRIAAQRARDSIAPPFAEETRTDAGARNSFAEERSEGRRAGSIGDARTNPVAKPLSAEELFGNDAADVLAGISAQMDAMQTYTAMPRSTDDGVMSPELKPVPALPSVPVVRFSKPMTVPLVTEPARAPTTKPGLGLVPAPRAPGPSRPPATVTPAAPSPVVATSPAAPPRSNRWLFVVAGLLLAGGTATAVALALGGNSDRDDDTLSAPIAPSPAHTAAPGVANAPAIGKVKFVLEPPDAEIKIEGKDVQQGAPWVTELPVGIHQIEIHRQGYKSWLTAIELSANETATLRVVLEPITSALTGDATLTIATTPPGLDVFIDGIALPIKTPIKTTLPVGPHKIVVRQNGVDVWQQNLNAEAASDYEFNPSFTDDKKRERAQRTPPRPAPTATPPVATPPTATTPPTLPPAPPAEPEPARPASTPVAPTPRGPAPPITTLSP
jgi:eukaryotic-like serine/threonine-protein kinase